MGNFTEEEFCCVHEIIDQLPENIGPTLLNYSTRECFHGNKSNHFSTVLRIMTNTRTPKYRIEDCNLVRPCDESVDTVNTLYIVFWVLLLFLIVASNMIVIVAIKKVFYLRQNITNLFISSLAVSDLLVGVFIIPIKIHFAYHNLHFCADHRVCNLNVTTDTIFFTASITNIFVITIDRFIALTKPYKYPNLMTSYRCKVLITLIWVYGCIWGILGNLKWDDISQPSIQVFDYQCMSNQNFLYSFFIYFLVFYIPVVIMGVLYYRIFAIARYHARSISKNNNNNYSKVDYEENERNSSSPETSRWSSDRLRSRYTANVLQTTQQENLQLRSCSKALQVVQYRRMLFKAVKTIATVYGTFVICWLPISIISLISTSCPECFSNKSKWSTIVFVEILPILNSALNPFIYVIMNKQYRKAFKGLLSCITMFKEKSPEMRRATTMTTIMSSPSGHF